MNNQEINQLVAKHVMNGRILQHERWNPAEDIADAWRVVEHLTRKNRVVGERADLYCKLTYAWDDDYGCWVYFDWKSTSDTHPLYGAQAPTAPLAICLAALRAVGIEV